jgi:2-dehydro-3-deoxyphosphogluconate aldolase/(4S)-4-hydroxy-2-oxoglutarate aldolase
MTPPEFTSHVDHAPRTEIVRRIAAEGIVPVIRAATPDLALRAARAVMAGGISVFEITMTVPDAPDVIRALVRELGDRALVGAGTVLSAAAAHQCIDAGAAFVVSPGLDPDTVVEAHGRGVPAMPGALTPTEVIAAWNLGADVVKIFPISAVGGAKYLRALKGPLPDVKMLPTGGITAANAAEFLAAGAVALGIGGELVDPIALAEGRDATITERARELRAVVLAARAAMSAKAG